MMARPILQLGSDNLSTRGFVTSIAFSPDSQLIAASAANAPTPTVWLFEIQSGVMTKRIAPADKPAGWIQSLAFSPDQSRLAWGEVGGYVALWDLAVDRLVWREKVHQNRVNDVRFSPDGKLLASCADDGTAVLRQVDDPERAVRNFDTGKGPEIGAYSGDGMGSSGGISLAFTPDSARLVVGSAASAEISIWRIQDGKLSRRIRKAHGNSGGSANPSLQSVAVTPDGRRIISSGQHTVPITDTKLKYGPKNVTMTEIRIWDIESGNRVKDLNGDEDHGFGYVSLSHDGKYIAVGDFSVLRWQRRRDSTRRADWQGTAAFCCRLPHRRGKAGGSRATISIVAGSLQRRRPGHGLVFGRRRRRLGCRIWKDDTQDSAPACTRLPRCCFARWEVTGNVRTSIRGRLRGRHNSPLRSGNR
jgi:WD40 repeat protein